MEEQAVGDWVPQIGQPRPWLEPQDSHQRVEVEVHHLHPLRLVLLRRHTEVAQVAVHVQMLLAVAFALTAEEVEVHPPLPLRLVLLRRRTGAAQVAEHVRMQSVAPFALTALEVVVEALKVPMGQDWRKPV